MVTTPSMQDEVSFITGVKADGTLTPTSYWGWNGNNPATYNSSWTRASKFGGNTAGSAGGTVNYYFDPNSNWSATEQTQLASGLALWAAVANINFVQTTDSSKAQISFTRGHDGGAYTYTIYNGTAGACQNGGNILGTIVSSPISIDTSVGGFGPLNGNFSNYGGYPIETFIHEEGHALGLGHAGAYNGSVNTGTQQFSAYDTRQWSLMSYINPTGSAKYSSQYSVTGTNWGGAYPTTWMPLDILAIQQLYGVAVNTPLNGGQTFGFNSNIDPSIKQYFDFTVNKKPIITIWDKGTNNTLDLSGFGCTSTVDLNPGTFSSTAGLKNNIAIAFDTAIDKLVTSQGATTVTCNNDGDTVIGGAGDDVFIGGTGNDVFDGGGGTNMVKYSGTYASYTITTDASGKTTISGGGAGVDTLTNITNVQFSDQTITLGATTPPPSPPPPPPASSSSGLSAYRDFNGDGMGDILMANKGTASVQLWLLDGTTKQAGATLSGPGSAWSTVLSGDLNGDGKTDLVWQNANTSALQVWTMDGTSKTSSTTLSSVPGAGWSLVATGDFNGDKNTDLVLENGSQVQLWLMNGATKLSSATIGTAAPAGFKVVATGDFNGDGNSDILWQDPTTGALDMWLMNGTSVASDNQLSSNPGASWSVIDSGDFNGDGKSDILLQDSTTGQTAIWMMDGATQLAGSGNASGNLGCSWTAVAAADYNGDGKSDILFRNPYSGAYTVWTMNGTGVQSDSGTLAANPGTSWHAQPVTKGVIAPASAPPSPSPGTSNQPLRRDFNGDGMGDILMANKGNASVQLWLLDGTTKQAGATLSGPGSAWSTVLSGDLNGDGKTDLVWQNVNTSALQVWTMNGTSKTSSTTLSSVPGAGWSLVATGDFNGDKNTDLVLENGSQVQLWLMNGATKLSSATIGTAAPAGFQVVATGDFNGDGNSDILWQDPTTGALDMWLMNGTSVASDNPLSSTPGANWRVIDSGDFNSDGKSDILLQNSNTGQTAIWMMDGATQLAGSGNVSGNLGSSWSAVAAADYNGDGTSDILFRNPYSGAYTVWTMNGTDVQSDSGTLAANPGTGWHALPGTKGVIAPASASPSPGTSNQPLRRDFNGDGMGDILMANKGNASVQIWLLDGATKQAGATLSGPGSAWSKVLTGDFNGDGKTDLLWQNVNTGAIQIWTMKGTSKASSTTLSSVPGAGWSAITTGDFNGDRNADIVLENGSQVQLWLMDGETKLSSATISTAAPAGFKVVTTGDFNGDGNTDILWQNPTNGDLDMWLMNGTSVASDNLLSSSLGANWQAITSGDFNGDGKSDILLQNSNTGQTAIWMMDGTTKLAGSGNVSGNLGSNWTAVGATDYNGDGTSDILFRNPYSGAYTVWTMNGTDLQSDSGTLAANPGTGWHALPGTKGVIAPASNSTETASNAWQIPGDFNTGGASDLLFHNLSSGNPGTWMTAGTKLMPSGLLSSRMGTYWHAAAA